MGDVTLITGISAAGKSTVGQLLAARLLPRSVHLRGDLFRRMVVNGREDMSATPSIEAIRQYRLRCELSATIADTYAREGFSVVLQDVIVGPHLTEVVSGISTRPLHVIVLCPSAAAVAAREDGRVKVAYRNESIEAFDEGFRATTPRIGLWLDSSDLTAVATVDRIVAARASGAALVPDLPAVSS